METKYIKKDTPTGIELEAGRPPIMNIVNAYLCEGCSDNNQATIIYWSIYRPTRHMDEDYFTCDGCGTFWEVITDDSN